jgi:hypothetical protein
MACKCISKLMVVMMELLILILLKVQANDPAHISFRPSSPSTMLPYFSELDKDLAPTSFSSSPLLILDPQSFELDKVKRTMYNCLEDKIKNCEKKGAQGTLEFEECILKAHRKCLIRHRYRKKMTYESSHCLLNCFEHRSHEIGACFLECYEKYFKTQ